MNDLCKVISIVSGIIITGIFFPFLDFAYGESDFVLEMSNASSNNEKLTLFAIEGETYRGGICPSGQCNLEGNIDPFFSPPASHPAWPVRLSRTENRHKTIQKSYAEVRNRNPT